MKIRELIPADRIELANRCLSEAEVRHNAPRDPIILQVAIGLGSWLSSLFVLGFLVAGFEPSEEGAIILGAIIMAAAVCIHHKAERLPVFFDQSLLAFLAAGHLLVLFGAAEAWEPFRDDMDYALVQTGLCLVGLFAYKRPIYRFSGLLLAVVLWIHVALEHNSAMLYHALLATQVVLFAYLALGLSKTNSYTLALAASLLVSIFYLDWMHSHTWVNGLEASLWPANLCMVLLLGVVCWRGIPNRWEHPLAIGAVILLLAALAFASTPGILLAVSLIVLGRSIEHRFIEVLGIGGLFASVVYYYYSLQTTLLMKSGTMLISGLVCLLIAAIAHRYHKSNVEEEVEA